MTHQRVRVNLPHTRRLDIYTLKSRLSPDGVLTSEDIEDLCHDLKASRNTLYWCLVLISAW